MSDLYAVAMIVGAVATAFAILPTVLILWGEDRLLALVVAVAMVNSALSVLSNGLGAMA